MRGLLQSRMAYSNIQVLVDDGTTAMPTKAVMIATLTAAVQSMREGDTLFIWYSGHGAQRANDGSEGGYDECWCPPDTILTGDYLTDNTLNSIVRLAPARSTIFIGSDSCHSGTVFDLKYILTEPSGLYANREIQKVRGRIPVALHGPSKLKELAHQPIALVRTVEPMNVLADSTYESTAANVFALSGCQDFDTSADGYENSQAQGAMSWAFQACFDKTLSLTAVLRNMRSMLKASGYTQVPQLSMGVLVDPNVTTLGHVLA